MYVTVTMAEQDVIIAILQAWLRQIGMIQSGVKSLRSKPISGQNSPRLVLLVGITIFF